MATQLVALWSSSSSSSPSTGTAASLTIGRSDPPGERLQRAVAENPVVVLGRRSCCMCHAARRLLAAVGAHPALVELEDDSELAEAAAASPPSWARSVAGSAASPVVFIGGDLVGGIDSLVEMHLANALVPRLGEAGALRLG